VVAVAVDLEQQARREGVDDRDPDAVEPTGDLVAGSAELAAGVQRGEDHLSRRLVRRRGVGVDGDPTAVVGYPTPTVGEMSTSMRVQ